MNPKLRAFLIVCLLYGFLIPFNVIMQSIRIQNIQAATQIVDSTPPTPYPAITTTLTLTTPTPEPTTTLILAPILPMQNKSQVEQFMKADRTNENPYTDIYQCVDFSNDVVSNAKLLGYQAETTYVAWEGREVTHAIVRFPTIEDGDVYVDATSGDWWVDFKFGQGNYNSHSMYYPYQCGFCDRTISLYGVKKNGIVAWIPTKLPTTPTPAPTPTPFPKPDFCVECVNFNSNTVNARDSRGNFITLQECDTANQLQNKAQVEEFMRWDTTNTIHWNTSNYTCADYVKQVHNNAENNSIKCALVAIYYTYAGHAIIAFDTIDDGLVFVDTTNCDRWVELEIGERYYSYPMAHLNVTGFQNNKRGSTDWPIVNSFDIYW